MIELFCTVEKKSYTFWYEIKYDKEPKPLVTVAPVSASRDPLEWPRTSIHRPIFHQQTYLLKSHPLNTKILHVSML